MFLFVSNFKMIGTLWTLCTVRSKSWQKLTTRKSSGFHNHSSTFIIIPFHFSLSTFPLSTFTCPLLHFSHFHNHSSDFVLTAIKSIPDLILFLLLVYFSSHVFLVLSFLSSFILSTFPLLLKSLLIIYILVESSVSSTCVIAMIMLVSMLVNSGDFYRTLVWISYLFVGECRLVCPFL